MAGRVDGRPLGLRSSRKEDAACAWSAFGTAGQSRMVACTQSRGAAAVHCYVEGPVED